MGVGFRYLGVSRVHVGYLEGRLDDVVAALPEQTIGAVHDGLQLAEGVAIDEADLDAGS